MMKTMKTLFDEYAMAAMQGLLAAQDKNNIDLLNRTGDGMEFCASVFEPESRRYI